VAEIKVCVESEIGPLRQVMVHRPGDEIERMTQHELDHLLFDDILSPPETVREHDLMVEILRVAGAETFDIVQLLELALERAPTAARSDLVTRACEQAGRREIARTLEQWSPGRLAYGLACGVYWHEIDGDAPAVPVDARLRTLARLRSQDRGDGTMALPPLPNLMFMRDPGVALGDRVIVGRMATAARAREPLLVAFAVVHSGVFRDPQLLFDDDDAHRHAAYRSLEGGDVMVLSPRVIMIGCSQRTSAQTIERLAHEALFEAFPALERVYAVFMPEERTVMHLDTILTQIDSRLFLGHEPLIAGVGGDAGGALAVARLERGQPPELVPRATVLDVMRAELGDDVLLVPCGGKDRLHQEREQWTDGANALCLAPGRVLLYARNVYTIAALRDHGFEEIKLHQVQRVDERHELLLAGMHRPRTVFSFSGSELSRARGGGRCLTMPLCRDGIPG
jgi:arginine deiminase